MICTTPPLRGVEPPNKTCELLFILYSKALGMSTALYIANLFDMRKCHGILLIENYAYMTLFHLTKWRLIIR